jgi:hypothetical protein
MEIKYLSINLRIILTLMMNIALQSQACNQLEVLTMEISKMKGRIKVIKIRVNLNQMRKKRCPLHNLTFSYL